MPYTLVAIQLLCFLAIALTGPWIADKPFLLALEIGGFLLATWSVVTMKLSNLSVSPALKTNAQLVTHGPYWLIRHPMYLAVLIVGFALILDSPSAMRIGILLILILNLIVKLEYEERLLKKEFCDYVLYTDKTWKLIPLLY